MPYTHKWLDMPSVTLRFSISQNILCIHCWLCRVFTAACGLSLVVASRGHSLVGMHELLQLQSTGSRVQGLQ